MLGGPLEFALDPRKRRLAPGSVMAMMTEPDVWDGHLLLVHSSEQQRRAGVAAWIRRGLDVGAKILYIEPADVPAERSLMQVMQRSNINADAAVRRGQLRVIPADGEAYDATLRASGIDDALAEGYPSVRCSAEATTAWGVMPASAHMDGEWATDELCRTRPVSILCQYPSRLAPATLQSAFAMHRGGLRDALFSAWPVPRGIALAGEVDVCNEPVLRSCLIAAVSAKVGEGSFVVDLRGLSFLDVSGVRALVTGTSAHRLNGGTVLLRAPQRPVERILGLLDVSRERGFVLKGEQ